MQGVQRQRWKRRALELTERENKVLALKSAVCSRQKFDGCSHFVSVRGVGEGAETEDQYIAPKRGVCSADGV